MPGVNQLVSFSVQVKSTNLGSQFMLFDETLLPSESLNAALPDHQEVIGLHSIICCLGQILFLNMGLLIKAVSLQYLEF